MEKKILIFILLLISNGIVNAVEYPFVPSHNEHFVVDDYESEMVGSAQHPVPVDPKYDPQTDGLKYFLWLVLTNEGPTWYNSEGGQDYLRMNGDDLSWVTDVDPEYWDEFKDKYPQYWDKVENYFEQNPDTPNNPFRVSLLDDTVGILILLLGGIAYLIYKFKFKKNEDFKN